MAHFVVRNEADRYLHECLAWTAQYVDHIHVYDDKSTDGTPFIADMVGAEVHVRPPDAPSFMDNESEFRQAAWESMQAKEGDWILCLDADEFLTSSPRPYAQDLSKVFRVDEVWEIVDGIPKIRIDGYWDQITAARLVPWTNESQFNKQKMGCGSLPEIFSKSTFETLEEPRILHYGYATQADKEAKYRRYKGLSGHNPRHIESILKPGELKYYY